MKRVKWVVLILAVAFAFYLCAGIVSAGTTYTRVEYTGTVIAIKSGDTWAWVYFDNGSIMPVGNGIVLQVGRYYDIVLDQPEVGYPKIVSIR